MKPSGKKSFHKLVIDDKFDHQFFGLVCHEPDYKTSLEINNKLNINLSSSDPVFLNSNTEINFSRFTAISRYTDLTYQLVCNKSENNTLSRNYPALDYLFVICGSLNNDIVEETQKKIREINEITAVFLLDQQKLSDEYIIIQNS
jgi:hypothetical protein